ncbi:MAG: Uncharacterised protein [Cellulomonadaceae bacterium TMED98]|nr:MAG: Uncharacterised protein [Cellulomonadaceae bacterium TMED98]
MNRLGQGIDEARDTGSGSEFDFGSCAKRVGVLGIGDIDVKPIGLSREVACTTLRFRSSEVFSRHYQIPLTGHTVGPARSSDRNAAGERVRLLSFFVRKNFDSFEDFFFRTGLGRRNRLHIFQARGLEAGISKSTSVAARRIFWT